MIKNIILTIFFFSLFLSNILFAKDNYFFEGEKLFNKKKFSQSKFKFEKDIVFNPKNDKSYLYLAKIFNEEKNDKMEEQNLKTTILLNPESEEAIYLLALLKIKKSDYSESEKLINTFNKICQNLCEKKVELIKKFSDIKPK